MRCSICVFPIKLTAHNAQKITKEVQKILKTYIFDKIYLLLDTNFNKLVKLENKGFAADFHIPNVLDDGTILNFVGPNAFLGTWQNLSFDNGIEFCPYSFTNAFAASVTLPKGLERIPNKCFYNSKIYHLYGMDDIVEIGEQAFRQSYFTDILWPPMAKIIPPHCFLNSALQSISGIENVEVVSIGAFKSCCIEKFNWPEKAACIHLECFRGSLLKEITGIENVVRIEDDAFRGTWLQSITWPTNVETIPEGCFEGSHIREVSNIENVNTIGAFAFAHSQLQTLDMLSSSIINIGVGAFSDVQNKEGIKKPYYMSEDEFE